MASSPDQKTMASRLSLVGLRMLGGWEFQGELPDHSHTVMIATPHTHNLDGLLLVLLSRSVGLKANWMVKDLWTKGPVGWITKPVGAVPVNREAPGGTVGQMVEQFGGRKFFHLLVPPEGTRGRAEYWKSGFYRIAMEADVPVIPAFLDYRTKRGGLGPAITLTGNKRADMDKIRSFYEDLAPLPRSPEQFGPIKLKDEDA